MAGRQKCDHAMTSSTGPSLSALVSEGAGNNGRGTRNQGHPGREISDAAAGVQDNEDVRPPAMIKVKQGQRTESVKNAMLNMMKISLKWCRITAIDEGMSLDDLLTELS